MEKPEERSESEPETTSAAQAQIPGDRGIPGDRLAAGLEELNRRQAIQYFMIDALREKLNISMQEMAELVAQSSARINAPRQVAVIQPAFPKVVVLSPDDVPLVKLG